MLRHLKCISTFLLVFTSVMAFANTKIYFSSERDDFQLEIYTQKMQVLKGKSDKLVINLSKPILASLIHGRNTYPIFITPKALVRVHVNTLGEISFKGSKSELNTEIASFLKTYFQTPATSVEIAINRYNTFSGMNRDARNTFKKEAIQLQLDYDLVNELWDFFIDNQETFSSTLKANPLRSNQIHFPQSELLRNTRQNHKIMWVYPYMRNRIVEDSLHLPISELMSLENFRITFNRMYASSIDNQSKAKILKLMVIKTPQNEDVNFLKEIKPELQLIKKFKNKTDVDSAFDRIVSNNNTSIESTETFTFPPFKLIYNNQTDFDFGNKILVVNIWATWCKPCIQKMDGLKLLQKKYKENVSLLLLSIDKDEKKWREYVEKQLQEFTHHALIDSKGIKSLDKQIKWDNGIPRTFIVERNGSIIYRNKSYVSMKELDEKLAELTRK